MGGLGVKVQHFPLTLLVVLTTLTLPCERDRKKTVNIIKAIVRSVAHQFSHRPQPWHGRARHWLIASSMTRYCRPMRPCSSAASLQISNVECTMGIVVDTLQHGAADFTVYCFQIETVG